MQVILKRTWFVGGHRYRSFGKQPVEVPDRFRDILPKDAVVIEPTVKPFDGFDMGPDEVKANEVKANEVKMEKDYVNPAHDLDPERQFAEAFSEVNKDADKEVKAAREKLKKQ